VPVEEADCEKDLGVTFTTDVKTAAHCKDVLTTLYKSLVRQDLEYCSTTWNPHYNEDKFLLKKYRTALHGFPHLRPLPYETSLRQLGLWSLEERRDMDDLIELFKMMKG